MTVTVFVPDPSHSPLQRVGQGLVVVGTVSGPTLLDDYIQVGCTDSFLGSLAASGSYVLHGGTSFTVALDDAIFGSPGTADGRTLTMQVEARHATGVVFDSATYLAAFANDPHSGLGGLITRHAGGGGHDAMLDTILAAVRKTF